MFCVQVVYKTTFCEQFFFFKRGSEIDFEKLFCHVIGKMCSLSKDCIGKNADESLTALCPLAWIKSTEDKTEIQRWNVQVSCNLMMQDSRWRERYGFKSIMEKEVISEFQFAHVFV